MNVVLRIVARLRAHGALKAGLTVGLGTLLCVPYFVLQHVGEHAATIMPRTVVDDLVPYDERWIWVYLSLYVLMLAPAWLARSNEALVRFAIGFAIVCVVSHLVFLVFPTAMAPSHLVDRAAGMGFVLSIDGQANAFPSLHASLAMFAALCTPSLLGAPRRARAIARLGTVAWALAIAYSTLPTRRHVVADLVAGLVLAVAAFAVIVPQGRRATTTLVVPKRRSTAAARKIVERGVENEVRLLRRLKGRRRVAEIALFAALWTAGAVLTLESAGAVTLPLVVRVAGQCVGVAISAVGLNAFVLMLHEGMHGTLFASRFANRWASVLFGSFALMSYSAYRVLHLRHHEFLGDRRDPDDYDNYTKHRGVVWALHYVRLAAGTFLYLALIPILALRHGQRAERRAIVFEYILLAAAVAIVAATVPARTLGLVWGLPAIVVAYVTAVRGFTQHGIGDASDPFLASRSLESPRLVAFCLLNENLHLEHHLFPEVPSYNLGRLHDLLADRIPYRITGRSYFGFLLAFVRATPSMDRRPIGLEIVDTRVGTS